MKRFKKLLLTLFVMIFVFLVFLLWYQNRYAMDEVKAYDMNSPSFEKKLLIATQGSQFKNIVTDGVLNYFEQDSVYVKVIDVSLLTTIAPEDYNAIVVIHTWENWKPPIAVKNFIERTKIDKAKIVVLTTSGEGSYKMEDVDATTGESILEDTPLFVDKILGKLKPLLEK